MWCNSISSVRVLLAGALLASILLSVTGRCDETVREIEALAIFKAGQAWAGDVKIDHAEYGADRGLSLGVAFDHPISDRFWLGLGADFRRMNWTLPYREAHGTLLEIDARLKYALPVEPTGIQLCPGVGIGLGSLPNMDIVRGSSYLSASVFLELLLSVSRLVDVGLEVGGWGTLNGSDDSNDIKIGPLAFMRAEVALKPAALTRAIPRESDTGGEGRPIRWFVKAGALAPTEIHNLEAGSAVRTATGLSLGAACDVPVWTFASIGTAVDYHQLEKDYSMFAWEARLGPLPAMEYGRLSLRPVGIVGLGILDQTALTERRSDHMVYGFGIEACWESSTGPAWLLEFSFYDLGAANEKGSVGVRDVDMDPLIATRIGMVF